MALRAPDADDDEGDKDLKSTRQEHRQQQGHEKQTQHLQEEQQQEQQQEKQQQQELQQLERCEERRKEERHGKQLERQEELQQEGKGGDTKQKKYNEKEKQQRLQQEQELEEEQVHGRREMGHVEEQQEGEQQEQLQELQHEYQPKGLHAKQKGHESDRTDEAGDEVDTSAAQRVLEFFGVDIDNLESETNDEEEKPCLPLRAPSQRKRGPPNRYAVTVSTKIKEGGGGSKSLEEGKTVSEGYTSDVIGVHYDPTMSSKPWVAIVFYEENRVLLYATFDGKLKACMAVDAAVRFLHRHNACSNYSIDGTTFMFPRAGTNTNKHRIHHNAKTGNNTAKDKAYMARGVYCQQQLENGVLPFKRTNIYKLLKPDAVQAFYATGSGDDGSGVDKGEKIFKTSTRKPAQYPGPSLQSQQQDHARISRHGGIYWHHHLHAWRADILLDVGAFQPPRRHVVELFEDEGGRLRHSSSRCGSTQPQDMYRRTMDGISHNRVCHRHRHRTYKMKARLVAEGLIEGSSS